MPFNRPTLKTLIERATTDIEARLPGVDARLRRSILNALARVHAAAVHGLYGRLAYIEDQVFPDTADAEHLDRLASIWGVTRNPAAKAKGETINFTGTNGTPIPAGTVVQRSDGVEFKTDAEVSVAAGTATAAVTASVAGAAGNTAAGSALTLITPIAGVNSAATVAGDGIVQGTDVEADDALRERLIDRIQQPPHGGASFDYVAWAKEVSGVTRAWVFPLELGAGTVTVRFVRDDDSPSIIPDAAEVEVVQDYIDARRPVTAAVTVVAPVAVPLNFTIAAVPNSVDVRASIEASLRDLLRREGEPGGTILLSHIREAISVAADESDHSLTVPNANVAHGIGQIPVMGVITWV